MGHPVECKKTKINFKKCKKILYLYIKSVRNKFLLYTPYPSPCIDFTILPNAILALLTPVCLYYGRIHLVHLRIHKYLTDDPSVNFHDKFFLHFLLKFRKKWRKNLSWKFMDESSVKYLQIRKWTRWIRPKNKINVFRNFFFTPKNLFEKLKKKWF